MNPPTARQIEVLFFIAQYKGEKLRPPSLRNIGSHFRITVKGAMDHVDALQRKDLITRDSAAKARSIRITELGRGILGNHGISNNQVYKRMKGND